MFWKLISGYDKLKVKPTSVVFLVEEAISGRTILRQTLSLSRIMGFRNITHYCELPNVPSEEDIDEDDDPRSMGWVGSDGLP